MRRFVLICLLLLLPFQAVWGAAASYCQHEEGTKRTHLGHHAHKHQDKAGESGHSSQDVKKKTALSGDDPDCVTCHIVCGYAVGADVQLVDAEIDHGVAPANSKVHLTPSPFLIERPKWALAA